ncbi:MAG: MotA/TolQ/ExbB proton channel family protein [Bacteroidia bacterium]|nr:MotA/TolQ/ExbB proton channel family protein [Bacteroidia bacterium]
MKPFLLQITETTATVAATPAVEGSQSLFDLALKGGLVMIPLAILSIMAVYLTVERYLTIKKASKLDAHFMANIKDMVLNGNIKGAKALCERTNSPIARMLDKGISRIGKPLQNIDVSIQNAGNLEINKLEKGMPTLATISGAAPMLGFLGTVTGMVTAFYNMSQAGSNLTVSLLAGGIYEALVTTVTGLIIGIFAYVAYNQLTAMIEKIIHQMEASSVEFIDLLQEPA